MEDAIDSWTIGDPSRDDVVFQVIIWADYDAKPDDADCYSDEDKRLWREDSWRYVGVEVRPVVNGDELESASDALWAVEWGDNPNWANGKGTIGRDEIMEHPVNDQILPTVKENLRNTLTALQVTIERILQN
jgi:hypothetical protein